MRTNLPVTDREVIVSDDDSIVSRTDLKGRIVYINPTFERISGFTPDECLGKAHNIVRHPDMPPEAFEDLWLTLQSGHPWTGLVKNRCKNGDYYWVRANVTPIRTGGEITGYLSVRTRPAREDVDAADAIYRTMRSGAKHGITLRQGSPVLGGIRGLGDRLLRLPAGTRLGMFLGAQLVMIAMIVGRLATGAGPFDWAVAAIGGALAAVSVGGIAWFRWTWVEPMEQARRQAMLVASGDLGATFPGSADRAISALLTAFSQMVANLKATIGDVEGSVTGLRAATREVSSGNTELSQRTEAQASALQQTAASIEQLTGSLKNTASSTGEAQQAALATNSKAESGGAAVEEVGRVMEAIRSDFRRIGDIVALIDSIAFQTNILALNAAVEAARAGSEGRGFAVVASEVRNLAGRCGEAAREIKGLIDQMGKRVQDSDKAVLLAADSMKEIIVGVGRVTTLIAEIAQASREQSDGIDQINDAMSSIDATTHQNASMVEETSALAVQLGQDADTLSESVRMFADATRRH